MFTVRLRRCVADATAGDSTLSVTDGAEVAAAATEEEEEEVAISGLEAVNDAKVAPRCADDDDEEEVGEAIGPEAVDEAEVVARCAGYAAGSAGRQRWK